MKKKDFQSQLKAFRLETAGAACFVDALNNKFCANGLTRQQAEDFAQQHGLTLIGWNLGQSCSEVNC